MVEAIVELSVSLEHLCLNALVERTCDRMVFHKVEGEVCQVELGLVDVLL